MRIRGVGVFWLLLSFGLLLIAAETASGQGPLRRLIQRRSQNNCCTQPSCNDCCELQFQQAVCDCVRKFPCDWRSQQNCITIAQIACLECQSDHKPRPTYSTCMEEYTSALNSCKDENGNVSLACQTYANCVLARCQHLATCPAPCMHNLKCIPPPPQ